MLPDTKQLLIMKRLTALLETITPANGCDFDLSDRVYRGRANFGSDEPLPFVSILESLRPDPRPETAGDEKLTRLEQWEVLVQGWCEENRTFPTDDLYNLKGAVEARLAWIVAKNRDGTLVSPQWYRLGGLIAELRIGPGVVRAAMPSVGGAQAFYLPLLIGYAINLADPYATS